MIRYRTNLQKATTALVRALYPNTDLQQFEHILLSDPHYPSLLAASGALDEIGIAHEAVRVTSKQIEALPKPFLAYGRFTETTKDFFLVQDVKNEEVQFQNEFGRRKTIARNEFIKKWDGIALFAEPAKEPPVYLVSKPASHQKRFAWMKLILAICVGIFFLSISAGMLTSLSLLLKCLGVAITCLLLVYEFNDHADAIKQFCKAGKTLNCDAVLHSKGAKLFGISWGESGWAYFTVALGYTLLATVKQSPGMLQLSRFMALAVAPYIIYSLYYQRVVVKQWCSLCLAVQAVLLLDALLAVWAIRYQQPMILPNITTAIPLIITGAFVVAAWVLVKPWLSKAIVSEEWRFAYERLVNDHAVFEAMLARQPKVVGGYEQCTLLFGNADAKVEILKVCNPFCGPCSKAHPYLEDIINRNPNVKLRVAFIMAAADEHKIGQVIHQFIALYQLHGAAAAAAAMHYWYGSAEKDVAALKAKYPVAADFDTSAFRQAMAKWEKEAEVIATPTLFVSGHRLPRQYNWQNLKRVLLSHN